MPEKLTTTDEEFKVMEWNSFLYLFETNFMRYLDFKIIWTSDINFIWSFSLLVLCNKKCKYLRYEKFAEEYIKIFR